MTTCPQCGAENLPGMAYCEHCGTPLPAPEAASSPAAAPSVDPGAAQAIAGAQAVLDSLDDGAAAPAPAAEATDASVAAAQPPAEAEPAPVPAPEVAMPDPALNATPAPVLDVAALAPVVAPPLDAPDAAGAGFPSVAPPLGSAAGLTFTIVFGDTARFTMRDDVTNVGRSDVAQNWHPELDVIPLGGGDPNFGVSRHQAVIRRDGAVFSIVDVGSTNGTYVNGHILEYNKPADLHDGDTLAFGAFSGTIRIA